MKTKKIALNYTFEVGATVVIEVPESITPEQLHTAICEGGQLAEGLDYEADENREDFGYSCRAESCHESTKAHWSCVSEKDGEDLMEALRESELI
jgi:hypothetical protein